MITMNELFSGIGAQKSAFDRLGIECSVTGISDIDKYANQSYYAIHGQTRQYGDISKIGHLDYADLWTYSFPCQDLSVAGKQAGIHEGTRSGLLFEVERLLERAVKDGTQPKYLLLENVKALTSNKFFPDFQRWLDKLDTLGYKNYWKVLNAKNYGVPQNRERVFVVSIRKDLNQSYEFPKEIQLTNRLKDVLETNVDEKYYLSDDKVAWFMEHKRIDKTQPNSELKIQVLGHYMESKHEASRIVDSNGLYPTVKENHGTVPSVVEPKIIDEIYKNRPPREYGTYAPTLRAHHAGDLEVLNDFRIRKLTPRECWRLMGFTDEEFDKAQASGVSNCQLYKQAGNSIVVDVLVAIFRNLFL